MNSLMDASRLRVLTHPALLVVDEIGYLPVSQDGAVLFFQLISPGTRASTVLTSNKGFEEWCLGDHEARSSHIATSGATGCVQDLGRTA